MTIVCKPQIRQPVALLINLLDTVISLHEDTRPCDNKPDLISMRRNTLSVLSQLSKIGHDQADPISMQTVRQVLELDEAQANPGIEGASNLFYYLFDDWRAVYATVSSFQKRLHDLVFIPCSIETRIKLLTEVSNNRFWKTW